MRCRQVELDWSESLPHPDNRVEWEVWSNSNQACGPKCQKQTEFIEQFGPIASNLEQGGYTLFSPHYITWFCPEEYIKTLPCDLQCIRQGRYCAPDPDGDFEEGYNGRDVVEENLRQLCVFHVRRLSTVTRERCANALCVPGCKRNYAEAVDVVDIRERL